MRTARGMLIGLTGISLPPAVIAVIAPGLCKAGTVVFDSSKFVHCSVFILHVRSCCFNFGYYTPYSSGRGYWTKYFDIIFRWNYWYSGVSSYQLTRLLRFANLTDAFLHRRKSLTEWILDSVNLEERDSDNNAASLLAEGLGNSRNRSQRGLAVVAIRSFRGVQLDEL